MSGLTVMNGGKRRGRRSRGVGRKSRKSPVAKRSRGSKRRSGSKRRRGSKRRSGSKRRRGSKRGTRKVLGVFGL